jgi:hypothetical protein
MMHETKWRHLSWIQRVYNHSLQLATGNLDFCSISFKTKSSRHFYQTMYAKAIDSLLVWTPVSGKLLNYLTHLISIFNSLCFRRRYFEPFPNTLSHFICFIFQVYHRSWQLAKLQSWFAKSLDKGRSHHLEHRVNFSHSWKCPVRDVCMGGGRGHSECVDIYCNNLYVTIDGIWIGEWIYWPLIHTTRNYK